MNSIKQYFDFGDETTQNNIAAVIAKPAHNNDLIVSNMKCVIKLDKKNRKSHRVNVLGKHSSVDNEIEMSNISNILNRDLSFVSPMKEPAVVMVQEIVKLSVTPKKVDELIVAKTSISNAVEGKKVRNSKSEAENIENNIQLAKTKTSPSKKIAKEKDPQVPLSDIAKPSTSKNAFQMMMSARNKSIGSNSPGKEATTKTSPEPERLAKTKRKLMLEKWAESKGRAKKDKDEKAVEEYIKVKMDERAERLKEMLVKPKESNEVAVVPKRGRGRPKTKTNVVPKTRVRRLSSSDFEEVLPKEHIDKEFLSKLSSPTKKKDSLLGYFPKSSSNSPEVVPENTSTETAIPAATKRGRGRPKTKTNGMKSKSRTVRLSSIECGEAILSETEFLSKLSSPTKKKDSLLGYFPTSKSNSPEFVPEETPTAAATPDPMSSGRPKRNCVSTAKRYVDDDLSPEKNTPKRRCQRANSSQQTSSKSSKTPKETENEIVTIDCDESLSQPETRKPVKLAPLFIKLLPKPVIDPSVIRAKQDFLMSGIPEKMRMEIDQQKVFEESFEINFSFFPKVTHVAQYIAQDVVQTCLDSLEKLLMPICVSSHSEEIDILRCGTITSCCADSRVKFTVALSSIATLERRSMRSLLDMLKIDYKPFPTYRCFRQIVRQHEIYNIKSQMDDLNLSSNRGQLFTEKYKPESYEDILFNITPVGNLKKFLGCWTRRSSIDSESESTVGSSQSNDNAVVLIGPPGSGKTASVYALANEMNFKVIEINSGQKRTGKAMMQKLQEATQSHSVRDKKVDVIRKLLDESDDSMDSSEGGTGSGSQEKQLALILIEDADIVLEDDDGFINAINQLIITSKRPVVLIANNPNCAHLSKYISVNAITFEALEPLYISKYLSLMSLNENVYIDRQEIAKLFQHNNCDFRKTLLELQFFVLSGGDKGDHSSTTTATCKSSNDSQNKTNHSSDDDSTSSSSSSVSNPPRVHKQLFEFYSLDHNHPQTISNPPQFSKLWCNAHSIVDYQTATIDNVLEFYENISSGILFADQKRDVEYSCDLTNEIVSTMVDLTVQQCNPNFTMNTQDFKREQQYNFENKDSVVSHLLTSNVPLTAKSTATDYEPYLRSICRIERDRNINERRRNRRLYHYLRNWTDFNTFSCDVFDKFADVFGNDVN